MEKVVLQIDARKGTVFSTVGACGSGTPRRIEIEMKRINPTTIAPNKWMHG
jgi:hypothetical protein